MVLNPQFGWTGLRLGQGLTRLVHFLWQERIEETWKESTGLRRAEKRVLEKRLQAIVAMDLDLDQASLFYTLDMMPEKFTKISGRSLDKSLKRVNGWVSSAYAALVFINTNTPDCEAFVCSLDLGEQPRQYRFTENIVLYTFENGSVLRKFEH